MKICLEKQPSLTEPENIYWTAHCFGLDSDKLWEYWHEWDMATAFMEPTFCGAKTLYTNVLIAHFSALLKCPKHDFTSFWWLKAITPNINCYKETLKLFTSTTDNWHVLWALKMSSGSLALPPCPMLSYRLANIGSLGSISFTFPLILPSTTQLPSNPLNLIPCLQAAMLEVCLN